MAPHWTTLNTVVARASFFMRLLMSLLVSLLLACALACTLSQRAYAEDEPASEPPEDMNIVDPTQRADNSFIYDTTVASLFSQASLYNNRTVQVVGEVIGDRIDAGRGVSWITLTETNVNDKSTISVFISTDQTTRITNYGCYGVTGTTFQVYGTYHQACEEHDGLPDIHASSSEVLNPGGTEPDTVSGDEFIPGSIAIIIGVALMLAFRFARERTR